MLELLICTNLALGLVRAVRLRDRAAVLGGVAALYLLAADTLAVFPISGSLSWFHPFGVMFFGPGVLPQRHAGLLIPGPLIEGAGSAQGAASRRLRGGRVALLAAIGEAQSAAATSLRARCGGCAVCRCRCARHAHLHRARHGPTSRETVLTRDVAGVLERPRRGWLTSRLAFGDARLRLRP